MERKGQLDLIPGGLEKAEGEQGSQSRMVMLSKLAGLQVNNAGLRVLP